MSLYINDIFGSFSYWFRLFHLRSGIVVESRLHRVMVGDERDSRILLTDNLKLVATGESGIEDIVNRLRGSDLAPVMPGYFIICLWSGLAGV